MLRIQPLIALACASLLLGACDKVEVDPANQVTTGGSDPGPEPTGTPNSIMSWSGNTSYANMACLNGSVLTISCRPYNTLHRTLQITIPNFSGPGTYVMGTQASATYYPDNTYMAPPYTSTGTATGSVTISSYWSTVGASGTFSFTLYRSGQPLTFSNGVLDQVRPQCSWNSDLLTYTVGPLSPDHVVSSISSSSSNWTFQRTSTRLVLYHRNTTGVSNPSTQYNQLSLFIPLSVSVGTILNPSALTDFSISYIRPSGSHYDVSNASSHLTVTEHDTEARHLRCTYSVLLSGSLTMTGSVDILY